MATRLNPTNFGYQNFYSTTLTGDITSGTLTIGLATVPTPSSGVLIIEPDSTSSREVIVYTSKGASTITCPSDGRGYSGTSAAPHLTGSTVIMAPVDKWFTALASGELSTDPLRTELFFDYVASGMVWSGDSYASTRNASMTSGVIYINGRRLTATAVTSRSFTASKDTYIDASDNGDGTALLTYTEVANNAASPALAANNVRVGIIVTGASNIANVGSVNQGQEEKVLPIASSVAYSVTDSLGNLICPRDPSRKVLGYRHSRAAFSTASTTNVIVTGLSVPVIIPDGRKVKVTLSFGDATNNTIGAYANVGVHVGSISGETNRLTGGTFKCVAAANEPHPGEVIAIYTSSTTSQTFLASLKAIVAGTALLGGVALGHVEKGPVVLKVELV